MSSGDFSLCWLGYRKYPENGSQNTLVPQFTLSQTNHPSLSAFGFLFWWVHDSTERTFWRESLRFTQSKAGKYRLYWSRTTAFEITCLFIPSCKLSQSWLSNNYVKKELKKILNKKRFPPSEKIKFSKEFRKNCLRFPPSEKNKFS